MKMKDTTLSTNGIECDKKSKDARKADFAGQGQFCKQTAAQPADLAAASRCMTNSKSRNGPI
jgi:hypothetical protein